MDRVTPRNSCRFLPRAIAVGLLAVTIALLSGCTSFHDYVRNGFKVGPNYRKPPAPVADEWIDSKSKGVNMASVDLAGWWTVLRDPQLNALVEHAYRQNLSLRSAGTRILAARAQRNIAAGNLFPQSQQAFLDYSHDAVSGTKAFVPPQRFFDNSAVGVNLSWELDFWGRFRRGVEAANRELDASVENYDDALVLLIGEVASTYVEIRVFQQRLRYVAENIAIQTKLVEQAETRLKGGTGRLIDQGQQRSNLTDTYALREQLQIGLRQANNRLCVLLGMPVRDLMPELGDGPIPAAPPEVAVGMPVDLVRRRPDLRRAERLVAAQSARIGIATANLYPRLTLIGAFGYEAQSFSDLLTPKSLAGVIGPSVRWDILNYGRLVNGIRVQDASFQTAALDYQNAVLQAGREVEDGIVLFLRSQKRVLDLDVSAKEAKIAAEEALKLSSQVKFDLNQAFVTSNFLVAQQDKLAQSRGDIAQGLIQIYKALGGGWQIRLTGPPPVFQAPSEPIPPPAPAKKLEGRLLPAEPIFPRAANASGARLLPAESTVPPTVTGPRLLPAEPRFPAGPRLLPAVPTSANGEIPLDATFAPQRR